MKQSFMTEPTDEQFAAAFRTYCKTSAGTPAEEARAMLAALQAHGCLPSIEAPPQQQGMTVRQELVARLMCGGVTGDVFVADHLALNILALGDAQ